MRGGPGCFGLNFHSNVSRWFHKCLKVSASRMLGFRTRVETEYQLTRIARSNSTIIAGPWLGEVGFELLYWIPFLTWVASRFEIDRRRIVAVSRGGPELWYRRIAGSYYDVFDYFDPEEFRRANEKRRMEIGEQKQIQRSDLDEDVISKVVAVVGTSKTDVLHPSLMYQLYRRFWWGHASSDSVRACARFEPFQKSEPHEVLSDLPSEFVAAKFYVNDCFPSTETNRDFVRTAVDSLARSIPVVSLATGLTLDEHNSYEVPSLRDISGLVEARSNLEVQSAIVARAKAFVGTYGGFSYLSPFLGVPSIGLHSDPKGFARTHYELALAAFDEWGNQLLRNIDVAAPDALDQLTAGVGV